MVDYKTLPCMKQEVGGYARAIACIPHTKNEIEREYTILSLLLQIV